MLHFLFLPLREVFFSLPPVDTNILLLDTSLFALKQEDIEMYMQILELNILAQQAGM